MKNPSKTAQTSTHSPKTISRRKLAIIIVGIMVFLFSIKVISDTTGVSMTPEQKKMQTYLEEKYGEEFVVERPEYKNGGFGVEGIWVAHAYPKSDNQLKFMIDSNSYGTSDQYVAAIWSREETGKLREYTHTIATSYQFLNINARITLTGKLVEHARLGYPPLSEAKKNKRDLGYTLNIKAKSRDETLVDRDGEWVSLLINKIHSEEVETLFLKYSLLDSKDREYICHAVLTKRGYTGLDIKNCLTKGGKSWQRP